MVEPDEAVRSEWANSHPLAAGEERQSLPRFERTLDERLQPELEILAAKVVTPPRLSSAASPS
jgi:hypothetical protein